MAVIGAGPAGLPRPTSWPERAIRVTIFEALPYAGGMLRVGIPDYRLPPAVLDREIDVYPEDWAWIFNSESPIGKDVTIDELFDGRLQGGLRRPREPQRDAKLGIDGEDAEGVVPAVDFLGRLNLEGAGQSGRQRGRDRRRRRGHRRGPGGHRQGRRGDRCSTGASATRCPPSEEEVQAAEEKGSRSNGWGRPACRADRKRQRRRRVCAASRRSFGAEGAATAPGRRSAGSELRSSPATPCIAAIGQRVDGTFLRGHGRRGTDAAAGPWSADPVTYPDQPSRASLPAGRPYTGPSIVDRGGGRRDSEAAISIDRYLRGEDLA